ncbi:hypothetical protein FB45DRAFT_139908 [Roridomyces roridus]|uniref:SET domain-containing protein n=1 Tax=Roridomyces roridus TaxID=1738132 RepID=A0AAD7BHQ5_9AGAR|nr:hypothetical protein FB45DRAFT_139908 [Roridomyces roridus]
MNPTPFLRQSTWYGGRGIFATQPIPASALVHTSAAPYASVIYRHFRKEVCGHCFAYSFDARRSTWNIKLEAAGTGIWFCSEACRDEWLQTENVGELVEAVNIGVDRLAKNMGKRSGQSTPPVASPSPPVTQELIDEAWVAAESTPLPRDAALPALDEIELDTARFILSALVRRYIQDLDITPSSLASGSWTDLLELQNNELPLIRGRPEALSSHLRVYTFVRHIVRGVPALAPYLATSETIRAVFAREQGNVFGMYEASKEGEEMFGWSMYVSASFFNHDCAPNIRKERVGRAMRFYTTRDVAVGEELCTSYVDLTDDVMERRKQLSLNWYFDCICKRCENEGEGVPGK